MALVAGGPWFHILLNLKWLREIIKVSNIPWKDLIAMLVSDEPLDIEADRIRAAYARRQCGDLYSWFNPGHLFMIQGREQRLLTLLNRHGCKQLQTEKILEVGCGKGYWINDFIKWGARPENITGIDLIPEHIAMAKHLCPETVTLACGNAAHLEFPQATFDIVLQSTVFTSILDPVMKQRIASEMVRVLKPGGLILWYDYHMNNPRNRDVRGVKKPEIHNLFPGCRIELQRITLAPPICRTLAPYSFLLCSLLEKIPLLCTHYLGIIKKIA
jgi:SAM-dependent methyltransferase